MGESQGSILPPNPYLTENVMPRAVSALDAEHHHSAVEAVGLRAHQIDTLTSVKEMLQTGQTAMHIAEATGVGKTAIALQLANSLMHELRYDRITPSNTSQHGVAIFVSPTIDILEQTHGAAGKFAHAISVTDFYGKRHDTSGTVINTTYQSLPKLLEKLEAEGKHVRLLIADEVHMAIGNVRHTVLRNPKLDSAIMVGLTATPYFDQLGTLIERGQVSDNERWVGMFRNRAHEISISEGIDMGILSPLDMHMFNTYLKAEFTISNGEYSAGQVDSFVRQQERSMMVVATVAGMSGLEKMARVRNIRVDLGERAKEKIYEITEWHERIKGKQTLLFGSTVNHIREVRQMLIDAGVPEHEIGLIHGEMNKAEREAVKTAFQKSKIKYLLGIKVLGVGMDLPEAEVGLFMVPRLSPIDVEQELGRIMRIMENKRAIGIQFVDDYERTRPPILLPQILDPDTVLSYLPSLQARRSDKTPEEREKLKIQITGLSLDAYKRLTHSEQFYRRQLMNTENIEDVGRVLDRLISQVTAEFSGPDFQPIDQYEEIVRLLPERTFYKVNQLVLANLLSSDNHKATVAQKAFIMLNLKTILRLTNPYRENYDISDIVHEVLTELMEPTRIQSIARAAQVSGLTAGIAKTVIGQYIGRIELMQAVGWIEKGLFSPIKRYIEAHLAQNPSPAPATVQAWINQLFTKIPELGQYARGTIQEYIEAKMAVMEWDPQVEPIFNELEATMLEIDAVQGVLADSPLTLRERQVIEARFGKYLTLQEAASALGISSDRVRQVEMSALARLRQQRNLSRLRGDIPEEESSRSQPLTFEESMEEGRRWVAQQSQGMQPSPFDLSNEDDWADPWYDKDLSVNFDDIDDFDDDS